MTDDELARQLELRYMGGRNLGKTAFINEWLDVVTKAGILPKKDESVTEDIDYELIQNPLTLNEQTMDINRSQRPGNQLEERGNDMGETGGKTTDHQTYIRNDRLLPGPLEEQAGGD